MDYIEKLDLQTEEIEEVESLEKHKIIISEPFSVNKYKGHTDEFLAVDGDYNDGFNQLNETNGLGISCIVSKEVKEAREDVNGVYHEKLKDRIDSEVNNINTSLDIINHKTIRINSYKKEALENNDNGRLQRAINDLEENGILLIDENLNLSTSINLKSNITIFNRGNVINIENLQNYHVFSGVGLSNVFIDGLNINSNAVETDNQARAGIYFTCGDNDCKNITIQNCNLDSTKWGILINADRGLGSFNNVKILYNKVTNSKNLIVHDGIHLVGKINNSLIQGNYVNNRGDAGIALNMIATHQGKYNLVCDNISINNLVGVDFSGTQNSKAVNNICISNKVYQGSNPAIRIIEYNDSIPFGNVIENNILSNNNTLSSEHCFKIDIGYTNTDTSSIVRNNKFLNGGIYLRATNVLINGNVFEENSYIMLDNYCYDIIIEPNTFKKSFRINGSANKSLTSGVIIHRQNYNKNNENFYKNYNNTLWLTENYKYNFETLPILYNSFTTNSNSFVDVNNGVFNVKEDILVVGIDVLATLTTHRAYLQVCSIDGSVKCNIEISTTDGVGIENTNSCYISEGYAIKLTKGVYKLRLRSQLNDCILKNVKLLYI